MGKKRWRAVALVKGWGQAVDVATPADNAQGRTNTVSKGCIVTYRVGITIWK